MPQDNCDLYSLDVFCLVTFVSAQHALRAEKILNQLEFSFLIMPTPREVTADCGLSIKIRCQDKDSVKKTLISRKINVQGIYQLTRHLNRTYEVKLCSNVQPENDNT